MIVQILNTDSSILGHTVGIVANQVPVINPDEASKGAQFVRMCNQQYDYSPIPCHKTTEALHTTND